MRVKPTCNKHKQRQGKLDVNNLNDPTTKAKFESETEKRFKAEALCQDSSTATPEALWMTYKTILSETAGKTLGRIKRSPKKPWLCKEVLKLAEEKSQLRKQTSPANLERYKEVRAEIQRNIRRDKAVWLEDQCQQIRDLMQLENQ
jgi:hypothetical protein